MRLHLCTLRAAVLILAVGSLAWQSARGAVTFTVSPSSVSNTYNGYITLQITGLTTGQSVVVQKYLDANSNGVVDAGDYIVQQGNLTDGKASTAIGGVTNFNVPGDTDGATNGAITARFLFHNGDFFQTTVGQYLWVLSSTNGAFTPITNTFNVTNLPYGQQIAGTVTNNTGAVVSNAVVILFPPPRPGHHDLGTPVAGCVANNSGVYLIQMPPGAYVPLAFRSNYVGNYSTAPLVTLSNGQTLTTNLMLSNATTTVSGSFVDATNSSKVLPGVFTPLTTHTGLIVGGFTDTNGNFNVPVAAGQSWSVGSDSGGLIVHGYVGYDNTPTNVSSGATGVAIGFPRATALFYGSVLDNSGNPIPGIAIEARDNNNNLYQQDGYSDTNGNYVVPAVGGLGDNDPWQVDVDQNPTNYVFSQAAIQQNGGVAIAVGQAIQVNFTGLPATNYISGHVTTNGIAFVGVGVNAYANIGTNYFQTANADTDSNGNYTLSVANSNTWYVTFNYNCCTNCGGSDGLNNFGNYQNTNIAVNIFNNNGTANFAVQPCTGVQIFTNTLPGGQVNNFYDYCCLQGTTCSGNQYWSTGDPNFPPGLNLSGNGEISGNPQSSGTYTFNVSLSDSCSGSSVSQSFSITINQANPPLQITTTSLPNGTNGVAYSTNLQATGGVLPYDWSLEPGSASLPNGLTLSSNGLISGMPGAAVSNYQFIVQVMDTNGDFNSQTLSLNIVGGAAPLQITTASLPNGTNGVFYSQALGASGGQAPYNWSLAPGSANLPTGLGLGTNGVISGMPGLNVTNYQFIAQVTDSASNQSQRVLSLTIGGSAPRPVLALVHGALPGTVEFTFAGQNGVNYSVQASPDLTNWSSVLTFTGSGGVETINAPVQPGYKTLFYRVASP